MSPGDGVRPAPELLKELSAAGTLAVPRELASPRAMSDRPTWPASG